MGEHIRVMPVCLAMDEAAGVAAAQAVRDCAGDVHAIDTQALRARLKEHGVDLPDLLLTKAISQ